MDIFIENQLGKSLDRLTESHICNLLLKNHNFQIFCLGVNIARIARSVPVNCPTR